MKALRIIRIIIALLLLAASTAYLLCGGRFPALAFASVRLQIIPSMLASTVGITLFWLAITLMFGRVYCASVCPVGTLQDLGLRLGRMIGKGRAAKGFRYRHAFKRRYEIMFIYLLCVAIGVIAVPLILEPWNIYVNIMTVFRPSAVNAEWLRFGVGAGVGIAAGVVSLVVLLWAGCFFGRDFCTMICPVGTILGALDRRTVWHMEIDPEKCISCMKCEEICRCSCVKVVNRYVDNSRCVKCFDCVAVCPNDAMRYRADRARPRNPLLQRVRSTAAN